MIHIQLVNRNGENLQGLIRTAISEGKIKSFVTRRVKGGVTIAHKKFLGRITLERTRGPLVATVVCNNREREWQILEAFIGRLAYHFKNEISAINIQMDSE